MVPGKPVAQGSMVAYGRKVAASNASSLALFRDRVAIAAEREWAQDVDRTSAFQVSINFVFARPLGHFGKKGLFPSAPKFHVKRPDTDKLARSILDSLTHIVFNDDSQVSLLIANKTYAKDGEGEHTAIYINRFAE